jgi:hypothetical protein
LLPTKEVVLMRRIGVVLGVAAVMAAVVTLTAGVALAQEEPLPDLTIDKTGPSTVTSHEDVSWNIDVTNGGSGDAFLPSGAVLVRDDIRSRAGIIQGIGSGNFYTIEGVTGLPVGIDVQYPPGTTRTRFITDFVNPERESSDATISPGGALRGASVDAGTRGSGGHIINCATADPDNVIVESDESNNTDCVTTRIRP